MSLRKMKAGWIGFLNDEATFCSDAEALAKLGYAGMEGGEERLLRGGGEGLRRFQAMGLCVFTVSVGAGDLEPDNIPQVVERARSVGARRATIWAGQVNSSFWDKEPQYDAFMRELETFERAAAALKQEGITLTYHNHFQEFTVCFRGAQAFSHMLANTEDLQFLLDIAWTTYGGENPVDIMRRIAGRMPTIHVKDYCLPEAINNPGKPNLIFSALGTGAVDTVAALRCAAELGLEYVVVEQDQLRNLSRLDTLTLDYLHMKETGFVK